MTLTRLGGRLAMRNRVAAEVDWKHRAIEQWSADPCGPEVVGIEALIRARREYAPWMAQQLAYAEASGLDVLDVGCGQGIDVCEFARAGARVIGIDLTQKHVELARTHLAEARLEATVLQGDAESLPFPDQSFDRVVSNGVLHHTPGIKEALCEMRRVLRAPGTATVILYNRNSWHYWLNLFLWRGLLHGLIFRERGMAGVLSTNVERSSIGARPLVRVYSRRKIQEMLEQVGFESVSTWVSPFRPLDSPFTRGLPENAPLGGGWFVVGRAHRRCGHESAERASVRR
jgi:ubiquinone/menaquinone biosynthesis C-methylase UbiE